MRGMFQPILPGRAVCDAEGRILRREPAEPCPDLLTEEEAARYLRVDERSVGGELVRVGGKPLYDVLWRMQHPNKRRRPRLSPPIKIQGRPRYTREQLIEYIEAIRDAGASPLALRR